MTDCASRGAAPDLGADPGDRRGRRGRVRRRRRRVAPSSGRAGRALSRRRIVAGAQLGSAAAGAETQRRLSLAAGSARAGTRRRAGAAADGCVPLADPGDGHGDALIRRPTAPRSCCAPRCARAAFGSRRCRAPRGDRARRARRGDGAVGALALGDGVYRLWRARARHLRLPSPDDPAARRQPHRGRLLHRPRARASAAGVRRRRRRLYRAGQAACRRALGAVRQRRQRRLELRGAAEVGRAQALLPLRLQCGRASRRRRADAALARRTRLRPRSKSRSSSSPAAAAPRSLLDGAPGGEINLDGAADERATLDAATRTTPAPRTASAKSRSRR